MPYVIASVLVSVTLLLAPAVSQAEEAPPSSDPPTVSSLLASFAQMPGLEARFEEEKHIALLAAPLKSQGRLHFARPDRMLRRTTSPTTAAVLIRDGELSFSDGQRSDQLDLSSSPVVRHFVQSFVALLAGDEETLQRLYDITLTVGDDGWEMVLRPRPAALRRVLTELRVRGRGVELAELRVREASGDETITTFTEVDASRRYSPAEIEQIFRLPSSP